MKDKKVLAIIMIAIVLGGFNYVYGNPISKMRVQKETLQYYENSYKESFIVYESSYNLKIPAYIFQIGPKSNESIKFDTALYGQGLSDEYGGILAAAKLSKDVDDLLRTQYGSLNYEISAKEDPLTGYAGEKPNYFETNPEKRLHSNHYLLIISLEDPLTEPNALKEISENIKNIIESKLPYITPNLKVNIKLKSEPVAWESESKEAGQQVFLLFPTTK